MRQIKAGATGVSVDLYIIDATNRTPEIGVLWNAAGMDLKYRREGGLVVAITEAALSTPALDDAWESGGFLEIGNGSYRLDVPDAAFAVGADKVTIFGTVTGMIVLPVEVQLDGVDVITDAVWDEVLTGATHNVPSSAGRRLRQVEDVTVVREETAAGDGGGTDTIELDAGASAVDEFYLYCWIMLTSGTGAGQLRHMMGYDGTTKIATLDRDWLTVPAADSKFTVIARTTTMVHEISVSGLDQIVTALMAKSGITAGGTATYNDILKAFYALARGRIVQTANAYAFYDDDDATVLFTLTIAPTARTTA